MSFLKSIFGGDQVQAPQIESNVPNISGGGISGGLNKINGQSIYNIIPDASRTAAVGGLADTYGQLGDLTGGLRQTVAPGFNDLLNARLTQLNNSAQSAIGDLRQNLQSRRILGSSFGQDTISRANAEFNNQRDQITSDNFLQSLQANNQLLQQQYNAYAQKFQTGLNELNLEANLASSLGSKAADILNQNARTEAQLGEDASKANATNNMQLASGFGSFLGKMALAPFTGGLSLALPGGLSNMGGLGVPGLGASQSSMGGGYGGGIF